VKSKIFLFRKFLLIFGILGPFYYFIITSYIAISVNFCGKPCFFFKSKHTLQYSNDKLLEYCNNRSAISYLKKRFPSSLRLKKIGVIGGASAISFLTHSKPIRYAPLYWHQGTTYTNSLDFTGEYYDRIANQGDIFLIPRSSDPNDCGAVDVELRKQFGSTLSRHGFVLNKTQDWLIFNR